MMIYYLYYSAYACGVEGQMATSATGFSVPMIFSKTQISNKDLFVTLTAAYAYKFRE